MSTASAFAFQLPAGRETAEDRFNAHLLNVTFEAPQGVRRSAIGGGESVPEAIATAREELPAGTWTLVRWNPLYGE
ncbi:MAG TPA: hypothetical protein VD695_01885 [Gaiellaceae bacterium]|nr:hypothetical protein [Gaiellaceae bacterium]HXV95272.1 hypothetical protein [Gaiellaceae bacterium]